jgi:hypothetical protein
MLASLIVTLGLQINRQFLLTDVSHIMKLSRSLPVKYYGELHCKIVPTAIPNRAVLSMKDDRMHFFIHDNVFFRNCVWDGHVTLDEKKDVVRDMLKWAEGLQLSPNLAKYQDGIVFREVLDEQCGHRMK